MGQESRPSTETVPESKGRLTAAEVADYVLEIGGQLVAYGCPSYRIEEVVQAVAALEGYEAHTFALPTGLFLELRGGGLREPMLRMTRVRAWGIDLARLTEVDRIFNAVAERKLSLEDARGALRSVNTSKPTYPRLFSYLATAAVSGAAAVFFGGDLREVGAASATGLLIALLNSRLGKLPGGRFLLEFAGGAAAAAFAWWMARMRPGLVGEIVVVSSVITLLPGLTLTTGLAELARKSLVAGGARLMDAFGGLLLIIIGIALVAVRADPFIYGRTDTPHGFGVIFQVLALIVTTLAYAVHVSLPRKYLAAGVGSAVLGWGTAFLVGRGAPGHVVAFTAALAVSLFSNAMARVTSRPAQLFQIPGLALLLPGSMGLRSLEAFLGGELVSGAERAVSMALGAGSIVAGLLLANVVLPAKKLL